MSIESVRSSLNALENLAKNLGLDMQDIQRRDQAAPNAEQRPDSVNVTSNSLRRLQMNLDNEEPISKEEAMQTLQHVRNSSSEQLLQAHDGLDPQRVYALLGMDE